MGEPLKILKDSLYFRDILPIMKIKHIIFQVIFLSLLATAVMVSYGTVSLPSVEDVPFLAIADLEVKTDEKNGYDGQLPGDAAWVTFDEYEYDPAKPINWLRAKFIVPQAVLQQPRPLMLVIYSTASSEIYINDHFIGRNGEPAATADKEKAGRVYRSFPLKSENILAGENILTMRFSAHGFGPAWAVVKPDLEFTVFILPFEERGAVALEDYLPFLMMTGSIFTAAVFFFMGAYVRRKLDAEIWLAPMFALAWVELLQGILATLYSYPYSFHVFWMYFWYLSRIYAAVFLFRFVANRLDITIGMPWIYTWILPGLLLTAPLVLGNFTIEFGLFLSTILYSLLALGAALYAAWAKHTYGKLVLGVLLLFSSGFFLDQEMYLSNYYYYYMAALSVVLFVLQAVAFEHKRREAYEASRLSEKLELELLKSHLQPHFIMNTLMALAEWIRENPDIGVKMIHALASEFRILREIAGEQAIPLSREIELCNVHLELMSYRKDLKFRLEAQIEDDRAKVPPAVFHTLIENAMTHNRYRNKVAPFIVLQKKLSSGHMYYELVAPPGEPVKRKTRTGGVGLSYVKARLKDVWGDQHSVADRPTEEGGWRTVITIMKDTAADAYINR